MAVDLDKLENVFIKAALDIPAVMGASRTEPLRFTKLPFVYLTFIACPQVVSSTGYSQVTWMWQVTLTTSTSDKLQSQQQMKECLPGLLAITRLNPSLDDTCEWADIEDRQEVPFMIEDMGGYRKNLYLTAQTLESAI